MEIKKIEEDGGKSIDQHIENSIRRLFENRESEEQFQKRVELSIPMAKRAMETMFNKPYRKTRLPRKKKKAMKKLSPLFRLVKDPNFKMIEPSKSISSKDWNVTVNFKNSWR